MHSLLQPETTIPADPWADHLRRRQFETWHPSVRIFDDGDGWQGVVTEPDGTTIVTRPTLAALLDGLEDLADLGEFEAILSPPTPFSLLARRWGYWFDIRAPRDGMWSAARADSTGPVLTSATPAGLDAAMRATMRDLDAAGMLPA